jgi:hypothetical protein
VTLGVVVDIARAGAFTRRRVDRASVLFVGAPELPELSGSFRNPDFVVPRL